MPSYSKNDVVLLRYPFSDLSEAKVRPAVVVNAPHVSQDVFVVPLTSRLIPLLEGEFVLAHWQTEGLNVPTAVSVGYTQCINPWLPRLWAGCSKKMRAIWSWLYADGWGCCRR